MIRSISAERRAREDVWLTLRDAYEGTTSPASPLIRGSV